MNPNGSQELSEVVRDAKVCGSYDAALFVRTQCLVGSEAAEVRDVLSKYLIYCNLVIAFDGDEQRVNEAVREMEKPVTGIKIPIKGESQPCNVSCKVERSYHRPITARMPDGIVGAIA